MPAVIRTNGHVHEFGKIDLLDEWYKNLFSLSSVLSIRRIHDRTRIDRIRTVLSDTFKPTFFEHQFGQDGEVWDLHIVKRLLIGWNSPPCVSALYEVCDLLEFVKQYSPKLDATLKEQVGNPNNYWSTLSEAFVARAILRSGINFTADHVVNGTPLDGYMSFNNEPFNVECKKPFAPRQEEFDVMRRVLDTLVVDSLKRSFVGGYTIEVRIGRPFNGAALTSLKTLLKGAYLDFRDQGLQFNQTHVSQSENVRLRIIPYTVLLEGFETDESFMYVQMDIGKVEAIGDQVYANMNLRTSITYSQQEVMDKLIKTIKSAVKQKVKHGSDRSVIFIDSQELPDFQFGLLYQNEMLKDQDVKTAIHKARKDNIVIIAKRTYTDKGAVVQYHPFYSAKDQNLINQLRRGFGHNAKRVASG